MELWHHHEAQPQQVVRLGTEETVPWHERLRSPRTLAQLGILGGLFLVALLIIQWPSSHLAVRKGEKTVNPILSRVEFRFQDDDVTALKRRLVALVDVPPLFTPDERTTVSLCESLVGLVGEVAKAKSLEQMPEALRTEWRFDDPKAFETLKKSIGADPVPIQTQITKTFTLLADPRRLPIVDDKEAERIVKRGLDIDDLRRQLPAEEAASMASQLEDRPVVGLLILSQRDESLTLEQVAALSRTDYALARKDVCTHDQVDRIQARIERLMEPAMDPLFGDTAVAALAASMATRLGPTLVYSQTRTENLRTDAAEAVKPVWVEYKANSTLVEAGHEITDKDLKLLQQEQRRRLAELGWGHLLLAWFGAAVIVALLIVLLAVDTLRLEPHISRSFPRTLMLALLVVVVLGASKFISQMRGPEELCALLLAVAAMVVTIAYSQVFALAFVWSLLFMVAIAMRADVDWVITAAVGTSVAVLALGEINNRSVLVRVGGLAGAAFFVARAALAFWRLDYADSAGILAVLWSAFLYFCVGLASGVVLLAILPYIERAFGIVTNISLLELCDVNQPALRRVALDAPGTYTHSLLIGSLAEAAAEAIGANGLLARVGAYFHDIGKAAKPHFFAENWQEGENHHTGLSPATSSQIIMNHVKDGLEMANRVGLPPILKQFITEHHGTTQITYFYREAVRRQKAEGGVPPVESEYRYAGPKPRSRETALVMLADAVEGATRSQADRSATRIGQTVHDILMSRLLDGQLDKSGLTLTDLHTVEETLTKTLLSVYHGRIPYPTGRRAGEMPSAADAKDKDAGPGAGGGAPGGLPARGESSGLVGPPPSSS
jgi:cyclic-di-AMP phosphodiesterase PgpH